MQSTPISLHKISQQQSQQPSDIIVILKNFEFAPSLIQASINTNITIKIGENKRGFSDIHESKGFILAIEELEIQSDPLTYKKQWTFQIGHEGKYQLICLNYCKLKLKVNVCSNVFSEPSIIDQESETIEQNDGGKQMMIDKKDQFESFTYEQFQNLICSEQLTKFDDIPQYLLRCFKTELNILDKTKIRQKSIEKQQISSLTECRIRENSTNTQECSAIQQFDQGRKIPCSPENSKALTLFEDQERGELQARALKKTSSQVINLSQQWKQQIINSQKKSHQTFEQQVQSFIQSYSSNTKILLPSRGSTTINNILTLLQNRIQIIENII